MDRRCLNIAEASSRRSAAQHELPTRFARLLPAPALALAGLLAASLPATAQSPCGDQVRVRPGDTMFSIAERCDTNVQTLRRLNPGVDPQDMPVGLYLHLPHDEARAPDRDRNYRVRPGDTLFTLAQRFGLAIDAILSANPDIDPADLPIGRVIRVPIGPDFPPDRGRRGDRDETMTVRGTLTREGVECPALRSDNGRLYTLAGDIEPFEPGDRVVVRGRRAEISYCQQGVTISVRDIREAGR